MTVTSALPDGSPVCGAKLGFLGPLTGPAGNLATSIWQGAQLAVDQYNQAHPGCTVTLADFDSQTDPSRAPALATAAAADPQLVGIIGPLLSREASAALPILNRAGLTAITPSASDTKLSGSGWRVFHRAIANDAGQGAAAALYIAQELHAVKVFVIDDGSPYGTTVAGAVRRGLGGAVAGTDRIRQGQRAFPGTVGKVQASGATAVFFGGYFDDAGPLLKALRTAAVTATFVGGDGIQGPPFVDGATGQFVEGAVATLPCRPSLDLGFDSAFRAAFQAGPGNFSGIAYDVASIYLTGLAHGVGTRADMLSFVNSFDGTGGVSGGYKFTATGELDPSRSNVAIFVVHSGRFSYDHTISGQ
jgi:branched-chain amino acid transport system substrate-binding protein